MGDVEQTLRNVRAKNKVISISPHLASLAGGHFYQLHKNIFRELNQISDVQYMGKIDAANHKDDFFSGVIPRRISRPMPLSRLNLIELLIAQTDFIPAESTIYMYEGNFFWSLRISYYLFKNKENRAIVHLFDSRKTIHRFSSPFTGFIWRRTYSWLQSTTNGRLIYAADNPKYFSKLDELVPSISKIYLPLPKPRFDFGSTQKQDNKVFLVNIRGKTSLKNLQDLCKRLPKNLVFEVHGLGKNTVRNFNLPNVTVAASNLSEREYPLHISSYSKALFMYDPKDFEFQSSGRLLDCIALDIPVCVPLHTALSTQIGGNKGVYVFNQGDQNELYSAFVDEKELPLYVGSDSASFSSAFKRIYDIPLLQHESIDTQILRNCAHTTIYFVFYLSELLVSILRLEGRLKVGAILDKIKRSFL